MPRRNTSVSVSVSASASAAALAPAPSSDRSEGLFVGVDVSKARLDVGLWPGGRTQAFANAPEGIAKLVARMAKIKPRLIVFESTGGYERAAIKALQLAGLNVAMVNPKAVRHFAKSIGKLAKTDRIDAVVLARFGETAQPHQLAQPDENRENRDDLVTRRRQLVEQCAAEKNRLEHARRDGVRRSIENHIEYLNDEIADLQEQIAKAIEEDPRAKVVAEALQTVKGVGKVTSSTLVAEMPELGTIDRQRAAALVGVAPFNDDSGNHRGLRRISGGRHSIRSVLYMATLVAIQHNAVIQAHYNHLIAAGKPAKVAQVACMRKLLVHLNNLARTALATLVVLASAAPPQKAPATHTPLTPPMTP